MSVRIEDVLAEHQPCLRSETSRTRRWFWCACEGCDWESVAMHERDNQREAADHRAHVARMILAALDLEDSPAPEEQS